MDQRGSSLSTDFSLQPKESKTLRFILTWYAPYWEYNNFESKTHMYSTRFKSALEVAQYLAHNYDSLLQRILAWQQIIYSEKKLPGWLQDSLVNVLAILAQESCWIKSRDVNHWWGDEGFFHVCESLFGGRCSFGNDEFGEWPVNIFFPKLALRKLTAFKHYQKKDTGQTPSHLVGDWGPEFGGMLSLSGQVYVHMVDRNRLSLGDDKVLDECYPSVKDGLRFMFTVDEDGDAIPDVKGSHQYYDTWVMDSAAIHIATYWLATLQIAERMAQIQGDNEFVMECRSWYDRAKKTVEELLWNESAQSYLLYHNPATGNKSDTILSDQLFGEWFVRVHGLPSIVSEDRLKTVLSTLERLNVAATKHGIKTSARPDGSEDRSCLYAPLITPSYSTLVPSALMLYSGDAHLEKLGLEIVRRTWYNLVIRQNMAWDMPCMVKGDGTLALGLEYYHNTMLWSFPMAVLHQDLRTACSPGGFYYRIIQASQTGKL